MRLRRPFSATIAAITCLVALAPVSSQAADPWSPWTPRTTTEPGAWGSVAYGNDTFVAVAESGTDRVATSDNGTAWTTHAVPEGKWSDVTFGEGKFVAVANGGTNFFMSSTDGKSWTQHDLPAGATSSSTFLYGVAYGNDIFLAVGMGGVFYSADGITWNRATNLPSGGSIWRDVAFGADKFVLISSTGTTRVLTTQDGQTFAAPLDVPESTWSSITYGSNTFLVSASSDPNINLMSSSNGLTWTTRSLIPDASSLPESIRPRPGAVFYANEFFFTNSGLGGFYWSRNVADWTKIEGTNANLSSMTYAENLYVGVAKFGTNRIVTTADPFETPPATTTTAEETTTTTSSTTTTTLAPTTTTTTTVPKKQPTIPKAFGPNARRLAKYLDLTVPAGAKVRTKVADNSKRVCRVSVVGNLLAIRKGKCNVIVTVTPAKGRPTIKRATLNVG